MVNNKVENSKCKSIENGPNTVQLKKFQQKKHNEIHEAPNVWKIKNALMMGSVMDDKVAKPMDIK